MKRNQKGVIDLVFVAVLVVLLAAGTFTLWKINQTNEIVSRSENNLQTKTPTEIVADKSKQTNTQETLTTTELVFKYPGYPNADTYRVQIEHPESWAVNLTSWDGDEAQNPRHEIELVSPDNYRVSINDADGIGYSCSGDKSGEVVYTVVDKISTATPSFNFYYLAAERYFENDMQDSFVIINEKYSGEETSPLFLLSKGDEYTKTYENKYTCSPLEGPKGVSFGKAGPVLNVLVDGPSDSGESYFDGGFKAAFLDNQKDLRNVLESINITVE